MLDVLGTTDLGQQGVTLPMRYESRPEDQTYVVNYRLEGTTASGAPFRTMASLVIPEELDALERKGLLRP